MAATEGSCHSGWLWKKKSELSKTKFIGGHNKRFFTLDFGAEVFFYAHSDKEKKVSAPVPFADLLEVKAQAARKGSFSGMMGSTSLPFSLLLVTSAKEVALFAAEEAQIVAWIEALQQAIAVGKARRDRKDNRSASRASAASSVSASTGVPGSGQITPHEVSRGATPDQPAPAVLPDFVPAAPPAPVAAPPELTQDRASDVGALSVSPDQPMARTEQGWGAAKTEAGHTAAPYDDKSAGLSLHERLAQLQFSDSDSESEADAEAACVDAAQADALVSSVLDQGSVDLVPAGYGTADVRSRPSSRPSAGGTPPADTPPSPPPAVESWDSPEPQQVAVRESSWDAPPHAGALQATQADDLVVRESSWDAVSPKIMRESSWD